MIPGHGGSDFGVLALVCSFFSSPVCSIYKCLIFWIFSTCIDFSMRSGTLYGGFFLACDPAVNSIMVKRTRYESDSAVKQPLPEAAYDS